jgi:hypothetical protein
MHVIVLVGQNSLKSVYFTRLFSDGDMDRADFKALLDWYVGTPRLLGPPIYVVSCATPLFDCFTGGSAEVRLRDMQVLHVQRSRLLQMREEVSMRFNAMTKPP